MPDDFKDVDEYEKYLETRKECFEECSLAYNLDNGVQGESEESGLKWTVLRGKSGRSLKWTVARKITLYNAPYDQKFAED